MAVVRSGTPGMGKGQQHTSRAADFLALHQHEQRKEI
jgi:hypothetical protein